MPGKRRLRFFSSFFAPHTILFSKRSGNTASEIKKENFFLICPAVCRNFLRVSRSTAIFTAPGIFMIDRAAGERAAGQPGRSRVFQAVGSALENPVRFPQAQARAHVQHP
jgi:hypothetical protein